jgi:hypothetical protein
MIYKRKYAIAFQHHAGRNPARYLYFPWCRNRNFYRPFDDFLTASFERPLAYPKK